MNGWRALLRVLDPRAAREDAARLAAATASAEALRAEARALGSSTGTILEDLAFIQRRVDQLTALRQDDLDAPQRLDRLAPVLNRGAAEVHLEAALGRCRVEAQTPLTTCADFLPADLYTALVDAIPAPLFFRPASGGGEELPVPPKLAPAHVLATWLFMSDLARESLVPLLVTRFGPLVRAAIAARWPAVTPEDVLAALTQTQGRVVRRGALATGAPRAWDLVEAVVPLVGSGAADAGRNTAILAFGAPVPPETYERLALSPDHHVLHLAFGPDRAFRGRLAADPKGSSAAAAGRQI